jgi:hypothetical protein
MKKISLSLISVLVLCAAGFGQESGQAKEVPGQSAQSSTSAQNKPCVIVQHEAGHAFRNVMLLGVAGAVISKERYKVVESNVAGLTAGEKMHGDELQARTQGVRVQVLRKNTKEELQSAHDACGK